MKLFIFSISILLCFAYSAVGQRKADDITGVWLTTGDEPARIQIYKSGEKYFGKIIWLKNPVKNGLPRVDEKNPDKNKRGNPVIGLVILRDFKFDGDDEWEGGEIYDPQNGKTYSCYLYLKNDGTLKVRGFIGISMIGRTEIWSRVN